MKKVMMVLGIVGALAIGLFAVAVVGAEEGATDGVTRPIDDLASRVAEKLGVSDEEFVDAWNESAIEIIDEKIAAGEIDEETGEMLKERIAEADGIVLPRARWHQDDPRGHGLMLIGQAAQTVLETEDGELREAFGDGQSLLDVALEKGFTEEEFTADLLAEIQSVLDEKVEAGEISQERADAVYDCISENISDIINKTMDDRPTDLGFGRGVGPRGLGPFHGGGNGATTDAAVTDA